MRVRERQGPWVTLVMWDGFQCDGPRCENRKFRFYHPGSKNRPTKPTKPTKLTRLSGKKLHRNASVCFRLASRLIFGSLFPGNYFSARNSRSAMTPAWRLLDRIAAAAAAPPDQKSTADFAVAASTKKAAASCAAVPSGRDLVGAAAKLSMGASKQRRGRLYQHRRRKPLSCPPERVARASRRAGRVLPVPRPGDSAAIPGRLGDLSGSAAGGGHFGQICGPISGRSGWATMDRRGAALFSALGLAEGISARQLRGRTMEGR